MATEVTTVIPVYNGANYLRHTLDSLAKQTRLPDRVIVLDDGSTDGTCDLVRNYQPIQCNLIQNEKNLGLFPNMNRALEFASETHYLHLLHADDLIHPPFLHDLVSILEKEPRLSFAYSNIEWIDENGQPIEEIPPSSLPHMPFIQLSRKKFLVQQCELNSIGCGSLILKTNGQSIPLRFRSNYRHVADVIFYAELALIAPTIWKTERKLIQIRQHDGNATASNKKNIQSWVIDEWRAMKLISEMISENTLSRAIRRQKLKCMFAARSIVKQQNVRALYPKYANQIGTEVRKHISPWHFALGRWAVRLCRSAKPPTKRIRRLMSVLANY